MKNQKILFALMAIGLLTAGGYGLYRLGVSRGMHSGMTMSAPVASAAASGDAAKADSAGKKVLYWHDPMVPGQKFDKPGKSPFMDMQLVPVYAGDAGDEGKVSVSSRVQENLGIRTAEVIKGNLGQAIVAVGSVAYNERDVAQLQARSNGFVEHLYVKATLDAVHKGQALVDLYVPEWVAAQEEYLTAKRLHGAGADGLADAARQRMRLVGMSDAQIRQVDTSGKVQARATVTAPTGGVVTELAVHEGMTVAMGAPLFRINGLGTVWVNAEIPESLAAQISIGNAVEAHAAALPGTIFKGKISAILPDVNPVTRTLKARIELANPSGQLIPGMFVTANFVSPARKDVLLVPMEAVIQTGTRSVVMVDQGDGKFAPVDVDLGTETNGQSEIRAGLRAGQKVVVSGQFLIDSEASLKGTATRMGDMTAASPNIEASSAAGPISGPTHHGVGKVESIGKDEITISHGPIATLQWGAMTMGFAAPAGGLPKNIAVGDTVAFDIRPMSDGMFAIARIVPTVDVPAPASAPAARHPAKSGNGVAK
ncbi:Cobalt/zinc/cadmium efflux RND transporter [Collimonas arenae]|uniref:Cobalt/zinc/cadmium efflux RND transporter n=1 Tax=Collimonas arenae TaxID=279058 RepID=A0A0A1F6Z8_9BURK|nr:efflux RND transporter periplasmic adaptor subunit [Collimonas arenae]AIY39464.1 Cobalt/zinc/cadmium efflux RND transporter [Collimonas arenae]